MSANKKRLGKKFYLQDTVSVARQLLGCKLVRIVRGKRLSGLIVETEAYLGTVDPAAHSFHGRHTDRVHSMYLEGGHAYVYFVYGMHYCFNVVTRGIDQPEAVLVRALRPLEGVDSMRVRRGPKTSDLRLTDGPAKLCQALQIDKRCDGLSLLQGSLFIEAANRLDSPGYTRVETTPRIGIDYAGEAAGWPLRFVLREVI